MTDGQSQGTSVHQPHVEVCNGVLYCVDGGGQDSLADFHPILSWCSSLWRRGLSYSRSVIPKVQKWYRTRWRRRIRHSGLLDLARSGR